VTKVLVSVSDTPAIKQASAHAGRTDRLVLDVWSAILTAAGQPSGWKACSNWRASAREASHRSTGAMNSTL
jgi:hypothetical protein